MRILPLLLALIWLLAACSPPPQPSPTLPPPAAPTPDYVFQSSGSGEPRSLGYWLLWNSCAEGNQAETARANGGRSAGWILVDDLLADPGVLIGAVQVETCQQAVDLLLGMDAQGVQRTNDAAYTLAAQLLAAQLNLAVGSEYCPVSDQAVGAAQLLLLKLAFDGTQGYLGPPLATPDRDTALFLVEQLANYNTGALCR